METEGGLAQGVEGPPPLTNGSSPNWLELGREESGMVHAVLLCAAGGVEAGWCHGRSLWVAGAVVGARILPSAVPQGYRSGWPSAGAEVLMILGAVI